MSDNPIGAHSSVGQSGRLITGWSLVQAQVGPLFSPDPLIDQGRTLTSHNLKEQLLFLLQLQAIDARVKEIQAQIDALPARLEPVRRDLAKLEGMVAEEKQRVADTEAWQKQQQDQLAREQEALRAAKGKLSGSRTGKEFSAATREVEYKRRAISERETELKKVSEVLSTTSTQAGSHDEDISQLQDHLAKEDAEVAEKVAALQAEITEVTQPRDELRSKIDKGWLKTYDSLTTKRGFAVAPVVAGSCQGCHMNVPPQLNNILARMESLEVCPRCGRIIFRQDVVTDSEETAGA